MFVIGSIDCFAHNWKLDETPVLFIDEGILFQRVQLLLITTVH